MTIDEKGRVWHDAGLVRCVEAPCCGFTFGAVHTNGDGSFSCPLCDDVPDAEARGRAEERAAIAAWLRDEMRLAEPMDEAGCTNGHHIDAWRHAADRIESGAHTEGK